MIPDSEIDRAAASNEAANPSSRSLQVFSPRGLGLRAGLSRRCYSFRHYLGKHELPVNVTVDGLKKCVRKVKV